MKGWPAAGLVFTVALSLSLFGLAKGDVSPSGTPTQKASTPVKVLTAFTASDNVPPERANAISRCRKRGSGIIGSA